MSMKQIRLVSHLSMSMGLLLKIKEMFPGPEKGCSAGRDKCPRNSIFTDKQFTDYVKKMQKEIAKRTKASFLRYAANSRVTLTDDDIRIHRMVAYKSKHRIIVLIRVTKDVEIEIEEAG